MSLVILIVLVLGVGAGYLMPADVSGFLDSMFPLKAFPAKGTSYKSKGG